MQQDLFYSFGNLIYKIRYFIVIFWLALIAICIPFTPKIMEPFKAIGFVDPDSESAHANKILNDELGYSYNQYIVMYHSDKMFATQPKFIHEMKQSLSGISKIPVKHQIIYPEDNDKQISKDKHTAYAVILFKGQQEADVELLKQFKSVVKQPNGLTMQIGGEPIFLDDTKAQTQIDLYRAEYVGTPIAIITMLIVFGSVVAACVPIVLAGICAFLILMSLFFVGHLISLSVFTMNIALLLGLCLSLDYAILIINRFRDELALGCSAEEAVAMTQATAGKSVFFSAIAVLISLSALLLFPINVLFSVGVGGIAAVAVSLMVALLLLPAVLAILNKRLNWLPIPFIKQNNLNENPYIRWFLNKVVKYKYLFFIVVLFILLIVGYPFLNVRFGISDFRILPPSLESRQVFDQFADEFGESRLAPIVAIIKTSKGNILEKNNIDHLYHLADTILLDPRVDQITSIVTTDPRLTKKEYEMLYAPEQRSHLPAEMKKFLTINTHDEFTTFTIFSKYPSYSSVTTNLIKELRLTKPDHHLTIEVTGASANTIDVLKRISATFLYALLWIIAFTYLILLFFLRSIVLPFKAIFTTILSLFASYGLLVIVIQQGYLHELLNFEPQGMLDISLLIIIFCALFGISMDYEVFLLTRIKECYEQTGDNIKSIVFGIDHSWKIISSAAVIVILLCFSFMSAEILLVKAFGLGIAAAVFVDAFIIRTILVPATMAILGKWNWYLPKWLDYILPKITFDPERYLIKK